MTNAYATALVTAFDNRAAFELDKKASNTSMQKTLADMRKTVSHERIAEIMNACDVDANFINRETRVDSRFNVYAAEKVINIARTLASVANLNHYTLAIVKTMHALEANDLRATREDLQCACTAKSMMKHREAKREQFIKRYEKSVDVSTVSTQSSSSLNALLMYHLITETRDASNQSVYSLNRDNFVTLDLLVMLDLMSDDEAQQIVNASTSANVAETQEHVASV